MDGLPFNLCPKCDCKSSIPNKHGEIILPKYSVWLMGTFILAELVCIIVLAILLYMNKKKDYKMFSAPSSPTGENPDANRIFKTQTSQEMSVLKINTLPDNDNGFGTKFHGSESTCSINTLTARNNFANANSGSVNDVKVYKPVNKPLNQSMLLREQMKKICEDALAKSQNCGITASLKDLHDLLKYDDKTEEKQAANDKTASNPHLEIYEMNPSNIPVAGEEVDEVYDNLPMNDARNIIVEDDDSKYLLPISPGGYIQEPAYINARCRYTKF